MPQVITDRRDIDFVLYADSTMDVHFEWIPEGVGNYSATIYADVTDDQCASSYQDYSAKEFLVHEDFPDEEYYTIINNAYYN